MRRGRKPGPLEGDARLLDDEMSLEEREVRLRVADNLLVGTRPEYRYGRE